MTIKFCSLSSGSSGNCQYIEYENTKILIDAGLSGKTTDALLKCIGVDPEELDAIFITHEHIDHVMGAGILSRKYNLPIFANGETWEAMADKIKKIAGRNIKEFRIEEDFYFKDLYVRPMPIFHDAVNPNGYVFQTQESKISIVTDTGWISTEMLELMEDSDLYYLESNHDVDMLIKGSYPWPLKQRVLSTRGHLSNENSAQAVRKLVKGKGEAIILAHLSRDNNTPELAYRSMEANLKDMGIEVESGAVILDIAPRYTTSQVFTVGAAFQMS